jgi:hypothetical protein
MIRFKCLGCNAALRVPESRAGRSGKCPKCKQRLQVPLFAGSDHVPPVRAPVQDVPYPVEAPAVEHLAVVPVRSTPSQQAKNERTSLDLQRRERANQDLQRRALWTIMFGLLALIFMLMKLTMMVGQ